jgi:hypothetical protein
MNDQASGCQESRQASWPTPNIQHPSRRIRDQGNERVNCFRRVRLAVNVRLRHAFILKLAGVFDGKTWRFSA